MMMRCVAAVLLFATGTTAIADSPAKKDEHEKSADSPDKVICKRFQDTGSLVSSRRVCRTKRDWERDRDEARSTTNKTGFCGNQSLAGGC